MKKRILFVDDEPRILDGLRNRLRRKRKVWEMSFAGGGEQALELLRQHEIDVLVTDMRMPGMDGATLLQRVQKLHPHIVRIVLSGHAEVETAMRAVPVAHQYLAKPCDPGKLENVIDRALQLGAVIDSNVVHRLVGKIDVLPSLPDVYARLMKALADPDVTIEAVAGILKQDVGICAKLLQVVNSAFFRLPRAIGSIDEAVAYLGFNTIKQLALSVEVFGGAGAKVPNAAASVASLQQHSMLAARLAAAFVDEEKLRGDAFVGGLLHDVGVLLLLMELPDHFDRVGAIMRAEGCPIDEAEDALLGVNHSEIGAYLLGVWGLPYPIVEAVAYHHRPASVSQLGIDILTAVHVADALASEFSPQLLAGFEIRGQPVDPSYIESIGAADKWAGWRALAEREAQAMS